MNRLTLLAIFFVIIHLSGCEDSRSLEPEENLYEQDYKSAMVLSQRFAKVLLDATENPEIRSFLKREALKQFDGDYDILLAKSRNEQIESRMTDGRLVSLTFEDFLLGNTPASSSSGRITEVPNLIDSLLAVYPTLQISAPQLVSASIENWDPETDPYNVVLLPLDEENPAFLPGWDQHGNEIFLSAETEPEHLTFVIGPSERVIALTREEFDNLSSSSESGRISNTCSLQPIIADDSFAFIDSNDYTEYQECNQYAGGGSSSGSGTGSGSSSSNCKRPGGTSGKSGEEVVTQVRFKNIEALRSMESWFAGRIELRVYAFKWDIDFDRPVYETEEVQGSRDRFRFCQWFDCQVKTYEVNLGMNTFWNPNVHGDRMLYVWVEVDDSWSKKDINVVYETFIKNNRYVGDRDITLQKNADEIDREYVFYDDDICGDGTRYLANNKMYFWVTKDK